jgi:hypothetical protein
VDLPDQLVEQSALVAKLSTWKWLLVIATLLAAAGLLAWFANDALVEFYQHKSSGSMMLCLTSGACLLLILCQATACIAILFRCRNRPLFIIEIDGIRDYSLFTRGFGLIAWHNIESVAAPAGDLSSLFIRVNNYEELITRRHLILRIVLPFYGPLINIVYGGQIWLPIAYSDTNVSAVCNRISKFSGNKVFVPERFLK